MYPNPSSHISWYKNLFPDLVALSKTPQSPTHHPEGDVLTHTFLVVDEAAKRKNDAVHPFAFMLSALCHDFGKPATTIFNERKGDYTAYDHDIEGVSPAREFVKKICNDPFIIGYVTNMVALHMKPTMYARNNAKEKKWFKMFAQSVCPKDLLLLAECDFYGRKTDKDFAPLKQRMNAMLDAWIQARKIK